MLILDIASAQKITVTATASLEAITPDATGTREQCYQLTTGTACWVKQGDSGVVASKGDGEVFVPAGGSLLIFALASVGTHVSVVRDSADGFATLTKVRAFR